MNNLSIKQQAGYTLIEVMIASTLGLLLLAGAVNLFVSTSQTSNYQRALSDIQSRGRFITNYFSMEIGQAGWVNPSNSALTPDTITLSAAATNNNSSNCDDGATVVNSCDAIQISYVSTTDCLGGGGGATATYTNTYFVTDGNLMCRGSASGDTGDTGDTAQPFINDIDSFQLLFGLDDRDVTGTLYTAFDIQDGLVDSLIDHYVTADNVTDPSLVRSVRYAFLLRSREENAYDEVTTRTFTLLDEAAITYTDRRLRVLVSGTIIIANRP